jgi:HK97 family phage major capsid protein
MSAPGAIAAHAEMIENSASQRRLDIMKSIKQLHERRGALVREADLIIQNATREKRAVSNTEDITLERIKSEIFDCDAEIAKTMTGALVEGRSHRHGDDMNLEGYSLTRAINQAANGRLDGIEAEASQEIARRSGRNPNGFFIPNSLLTEKRGMSVTGGTNQQFGGALVATEVRGFLEALRPLSKVIAAGATIFDGLSSNISIPKLAAASTVTWKAETAALDESVPQVAQVELSPKRVGSFVELSNQLLIQSSPDIERFIRRDLLAACATALDAAAINGSGLSNEPTGILKTTGIGAVIGGTNGAAPAWADIVDLVGAVADANADFGTLAFLTNSRVASRLRSTAKLPGTDSQMILEIDRLLNYPLHVSNNVPSDLDKGSSVGVCSAIIFGNFEDVILASFGDGTDLIVDRFSKATNGITRLIANSYVDVGIRRPESFAAIQDALTL